jgi:UDP-glucose 4-epimerase
VKQKLIDLNGKKIFLTGGAGFMGSHLVDRLMKPQNKIIAFDNLSSGRLENIERWLRKSNFKFVQGDLLDRAMVETTIKDCELVIHLAANPEVAIGYEDTLIDLTQNVACTYNVLEAMRKSGAPSTILFTSTSTIYGDATILPTPEDYGPLMPISNYGASKLASEAFVSSYSHLYGMKAVIFRFANIVGLRGHGVVKDFIRKLKKNPKKLEILGDGSQKKSYLLINDCIDAFLHVLKSSTSETVSVFNIGSEDQIAVNKIADLIIEEMGLNNVKKVFGECVDGRGWHGDVKNMFLSINKLKNLGWRPTHNSEQSIRQATRQLLAGQEIPKL